ncbi:nucleotidyltransferase domain-containing protein [Clostridium cochlearium]|uniref:nucleotidyltransferase domain-containing protein n=1 Tax=Clostridium cochlearium TaxID=1494 RepID=UPI0014596DE6|nr:nucleotidyltransferase domain-containing protein [Clostridium cochlearium]NME95947.1 nucleotidyltransferase domain-containing protein [Clostridium cochlearium]
MKFGLTEKTYNLLIKTLSNYNEIEKVCVFGSRAMGNYKKGSDVDICIYGKLVTEKTISKLNVELNEELPIPYYFDIVYYDNIENNSLKEHIDRVGKVIFCRK